MQFSGLEIETKDGMFLVHQQATSVSSSGFIKMRSSHTFDHYARCYYGLQLKAKMLCVMALMAQVTQDKFNKDPAKYIEK